MANFLCECTLYEMGSSTNYDREFELLFVKAFVAVVRPTVNILPNTHARQTIHIVFNAYRRASSILCTLTHHAQRMHVWSPGCVREKQPDGNVKFGTFAHSIRIRP